MAHVRARATPRTPGPLFGVPAAGLAAAILTTTVAAAGDVAPPEPDREALKAQCKQGGYLRVVGVVVGNPPSACDSATRASA